MQFNLVRNIPNSWSKKRPAWRLQTKYSDNLKIVSQSIKRNVNAGMNAEKKPDKPR